MRKWRFLLGHQQLKCLLAPNISTTFSIHHNQVTTITSSSYSYSLSPLSIYRTTHNFLVPRHFSSNTSLYKNKNAHDGHLLLIYNTFTNFTNDDKIKEELESNNVVISHDLILSVLENLKLNPSVGIKFFDWVLKRDSEKLSSKGYNLMLEILGTNGFVKEFWDMVEFMKKKGYGVSKGTFIEVSNKFEKDDLLFDLEKLKGLFSKDAHASIEMGCSRIVKIVGKGRVWDDDVEKELRNLGVAYSSELVKMVLEKLSGEPMKGLAFFRWVEKSRVFEHDDATYNAMAIVLGRDDCVVEFWNIVTEMRDKGYEMEMKTYMKVLNRFTKRGMLNSAVSLYEFMMNGANKPSKQDCIFLLKKIAVARELDIVKFSRVVKVFTENGFALEDSMLDAVQNYLTSVGRMEEFNEILEAMVGGGFRPREAVHARVAFDLNGSGMKDETNEFILESEAGGLIPNHQTWASLIEGHCVAGDLEQARDCFQNMIQREGFSSVGYFFDMLVNAYCDRDRTVEAFKIVVDLVSRGNLQPSHLTYKALISKLLGQRRFEDALSLLGLMKNHGLPPYFDPFLAYFSRRGTADEAMLFLEAMTVKSVLSTSVFLHVFEAFSKAGRFREAQNFLGKCPHYIRNDAHVLNYIGSRKSEKPVTPAPAAV